MREYEEFVASRIKDPEQIRCTPFTANVQHMLMGLTGELGELTDVLKKHIIYERELDVDWAAEELGDLAFYLFGLVLALQPLGGPSWDEILSQNMEKLARRYPIRYSDECAAERADKH